MANTWKIRHPSGEISTLGTDLHPYHFFSESPSVVNESRADSGLGALDFQETNPFFDFLGFTTHDIAEIMEIDPSTLFRWKKEDRKLTKALTKNLLEIDRIIAKGVRIFGSEELFSEWLQSSNSALGNKKPATLLKNPYEIAKIDEALEAISWGNIL